VRITPNVITRSNVSLAERRVFGALAGLPDSEGVALHSVNLPEHDYKRMGELDFVVVTPDVLLAIEVKGGNIKQTSGSWEYHRRDGHIARSDEGPFRQAESGMFALEKKLKQVGIEIVTGTLVITPDVDLPMSTENSPKTYLGAHGFMAGELENALHRARAFALAANRNSSLPRTISPHLRKQILTAIRPDFDRVPTLAVQVGLLEARFAELTNAQLEYLDLIEENDRILCQGGAGSGKTFLALEMAKRRAATSAGVVVLTCSSPTLGAFLACREGLGSVKVRPFSTVATMPPDSVDCLVVDEAQDLLTFPDLDVFERVLRGGLEKGRWAFMFDHANQRLPGTLFDPEALSYISSLGATGAKLTRNCRNTEEIVRQTQLYTGADLGVAKAGAGQPVTFVNAVDALHEASNLDAHLQALFGDGIRPGAVTVLSMTGDWDASAIRNSKWAKRVLRLTDVAGQPRRPDMVTWASVADIKGLETDFLCVIDLVPEDLENRVAELYVAMTRPKAHLWISCHPGVDEHLRELGKRNLGKIGGSS